jgi:hypothetical protein
MSNYIGNNDFRGYLNYLQTQNDPMAGYALAHVGNDGVLDTQKLGTTAATHRPDGGHQDWMNQVTDYTQNQYNSWSNNVPTLGAGTNTGTGTGTGGTAPQSTWTPAQQSLYDMSVGQANRNLGRIPGQLNTAYGNIQDQFNQQRNALQSRRGQAQQDFTDSSTRNQQNYLTDQNMANAQGAKGLRGLLRQLGAMGGGGGSAYLYSAPEAVGDFVQQQLSGAGQGFAQNASQLTSTYDRFNQDSENQEKELNDWRGQQRSQAATQAEQQKINLRNLLSELAGQRALALNQNAQPMMQPQISAIEAAQNRIDELQRFSPTFSGETPVYSAPELSQFTPDSRPQIDVRGGAQGRGATPYLDVLLGRKRDENQPVI